VSLKKLKKFIGLDNIAEELDDETLNEIGDRVIRDFEIDWNSCNEWRELNDKGIKLAKQVAKKKSFPWENAANIKYPLITSAAMQFAARAYPEIIQGKDIVKVRVVGADPDGQKQRRARISSHMSYQIVEEMEEWEEQQDRLFHTLPIVGCQLKKTYFDSVKKRNMSDVLFPDEFAINYKSKSLETARRISHILEKYKNDIREYVREGVWLDYDFGDAETTEGDEDAPHRFIEQHRWLDLDKDGYEEPYIVTVHEKERKTVRIVARYDESSIEINEKDELIRIIPHQYFTKYGFIPNPDGGFLDIGFGTLLTPINESLNTVINELLDAGAIHNAGGGFIATGIRIKAGKLKFKLGEWKTVHTTAADLKNGIVPLPTREPSLVLFQMLGLLIEAGKDISSVKDVLMGEKPGENVSAETVLALIEQGMKVFSAIYKRIYRALTKEFQKLFWLNSKFIDPLAYQKVLDIPEQVDAFEDYNTTDLDIKPVADPNMTLDIQRLTKAKALMETLGTHPTQNVPEILRRYYTALKIPDIDTLFVEPSPNPEIEKLYAELDMEREKQYFEKLKILAEIRKIHADAVLALAKAEAQEQGTQLEEYKTAVEELGVILKHEEAKIQQRKINESKPQGNT
jgi:chaperonin GroES